MSLPPLQEDLGDYFSTICELFIVPVTQGVTLVPTPSILRVDSVSGASQIASNSPSESLPPFWREHSDFHSFLQLSFSSFSTVIKGSPSFPKASLGANYIPGIYALSCVSLRRYDAEEKAFVRIIAFPYGGIPLIPSIPEAVNLYFRLV